MLSLEDIKNISFRRAGFGGYKPEDVDDFIDKIQTSYEEIIRERQNLNLRIQKLEETVKKFHDEESSIRDVLLNLKGITEKSLSEAETKAKDIISQAEHTSEQMISTAKEKVSVQEEISRSLKQESSRLKARLEEIYKEHLEVIKKIPSIEFFETSKKETPQEEKLDLEVSNKLNSVIGGMREDLKQNYNLKLQGFKDLNYQARKPYREIFKEKN